MCPMFEGFPAIIYTGLWSLRVFRKLENLFPNSPFNIVFLLTDFPPATMLKIDKGNFEIKILEDVKDTKELDNLECDMYLASPLELLFKGINGIKDGIADNKIKIKNMEILTILAKIMGGGS